jgi:hypothetical protein
MTAETEDEGKIAFDKAKQEGIETLDQVAATSPALAVETGQDGREQTEKQVSFSAPVTLGERRAALDSGKSQYIDLATGTTATRRQSIRVVSFREQATGPQSKWQKMRHRFRSERALLKEKEKAEDQAADAEADLVYKQYRIHSGETNEGFFASASRPDVAASLITEGYRWAIKAPFWEMGLCSSVAYLILILCFALVIFWIGKEQPECISVPSENIEDGVDFIDSFHLSWTTLSTVGYGVMSPMTPTDTARW